MVMRNKIKQFIDSRGLTVYRFREDVGIANKTAYDLVNDPSKIPSGEVLDKICTTYEIQPGVLLEWVKND